MSSYQLLLTRCDYNTNVGCILHIHSKLDTIDSDDITQLITTLHTFLGSGHVKAVSWDTSIFLRNKKGYPTLSKAHQYIFAFIYGRLGRTIRTLVEGTDDNNAAAAGGGGGGGGGGATSRLHHLEYLHHLRSQSTLLAQLDTDEAIIETPYLDNLQSPLQPLGDHLEYSTYETFERDPIKYVRYGEAIALALEDGMKDGRFVYAGSTTQRRGGVNDNEVVGDGIVRSSSSIDIYRVTILVVGAGRGPLVREAIDAVARVSKTFENDNLVVAHSSQRRRAIYANIIAIEKNPSAIHYLRGLKHTESTWNGGQDYFDATSTLCCDTYKGVNDEVGQNDGGSIIPGTSNVTVIGCDMREASSNVQLRSMIQNEAHKADIVVSELLGSFGDNELSPECLDGVQQSGILKTTCVSIPQNYTSYIAPVSSARLHTEATTQSCLPLHPSHGPTSSPVGIQRAMETPYVVRTHAASQTHKEQPCWIFSHPYPSTVKTLSEEVTPAASLSDTLLGSGEDATCNSSSANAAHNINNDRYAHISFPHDPTHGISHGCGYGAVNDNDPPSFLSSTPSTAISNSNMQSDSTIIIHGFLGSFHSVLYEAKDKNRSSIISIAPNSFSVGMFSWFPLVSIDLCFVCEYISKTPNFFAYMALDSSTSFIFTQP
jgi:protein arginine N-methyltransferase 5